MEQTEGRLLRPSAPIAHEGPGGSSTTPPCFAPMNPRVIHDSRIAQHALDVLIDLRRKFAKTLIIAMHSRELGIRSAVGAGPGSIRRMVLINGGRWGRSRMPGEASRGWDFRSFLCMLSTNNRLAGPFSSIPRRRRSFWPRWPLLWGRRSGPLWLRAKDLLQRRSDISRFSGLRRALGGIAVVLLAGVAPLGPGI